MDEEEVSIYVPDDYSVAADIIADLKKMAESIEIYIDEKVKKSGGGTTDYNNLENKPTKLSDFENDENFITETDVDNKIGDIDTLLSAIADESEAI